MEVMVPVVDLDLAPIFWRPLPIHYSLNMNIITKAKGVPLFQYGDLL